MAHLAIVGSGITGAVSAFLLKRRFPQLNVTILEKARGTGGRMCTSRSNENQACTADLGAQYITKTSSLSEVQKSCYDNLISAGLLEPLHGQIDGMHTFREPVDHFVCPQGSGSLVKYFIQKSGAELCFGHKVTSVTVSTDDRWTVGIENLPEKTFDGVIFTVPVPQALQVNIRSINTLDDKQFEKMKTVRYNSHYALAQFFTKDQVVNPYPYVAKYFSDSPSIRYISFDDRKRGRNSSGRLQSLVVHSTKTFAEAHLEKNADAVIQMLTEDLNKLLPNLPSPSEVKLIRWRYSQVEEPYPGQPGFVTLCTKPLLVCGGDGFSKSSLEGCLFSAERIADVICDQIK